MRIQTKRIFAGLGLLLLLLMSPAVAHATSCATNPDQQSCSSSYGVSESFFGSGGELQACSTSYCSKQSAGELTVGNTSSANYQAQAGFNTDREPWIGVAIVGSPAVDLGVLDVSSTKSGSAQFKVSAYLSDGYVVQINGTSPTNSGHALTPMAGAAVATNTEQFGMNLVANTSPSVGADPVQDPNYPAQPFGFGDAETGYDTADIFKFNSGDVIASSAQSTSYTVYTISYVANITSITPGGTYIAQQSVVATATF
ncbi:hypothetical protein KDA14_01585 [Candidatus Saccharibacteria bacterium]|nr:hypothetical protein [Candidatus Saccharibacteria bacterium]